MLEVHCPNCEAVMQIPAQHAGANGQCRHCGAPLRAPRSDDGEPTSDRLRPEESFHLALEGTEGKNPDGTKRQDLLALCQPGERLRLMRPGDEPPGQKHIGVCRVTGHQLGYVTGDIIEALAAAPPSEEWSEIEVMRITEQPRRFGRKPLLGMEVAIRRYRGDLLPPEAGAAQRFRRQRFPYDPQKESDANLLARVAKDLEQLGPPTDDCLEKHFRYHRLLKWYYNQREREEALLHLAIMVCQMQIALAPEVRKAMLAGPFKGKRLPRHGGFELLSTIREKQRLYDHAVELCEEARKQGWYHDWNIRIERCNRKKAKGMGAD